MPIMPPAKIPGSNLAAMSSHTNPFAANYRGSVTPQSSQTNPFAANYQGRMTSGYMQQPNYAPAPGGQVLGDSDNRNNGGAPGGEQVGGIVNGQWYPADQYDAARRAFEDPYREVRNDISSAWDNYLNSLQGTSGYLTDQRAAQEGIAKSALAAGEEAILGQKAASLRDIANTTRNAFAAGNNYLGSLGAGDSSGANQYSFAINQQANKQTGDLNNFVSGEMNKLKSTYDQQIQGIAQWFAQQQEALKQQIAQGGLQKGQDLANLSKGILDQAIQATNALKANSQNQYNALVQWAASNSENLGQLQQNIAGIPGVMGQLNIGAGGGFGGGRPAYGGAPTTKTDIFGNPIV